MEDGRGAGARIPPRRPLSAAGGGSRPGLHRGAAARRADRDRRWRRGDPGGRDVPGPERGGGRDRQGPHRGPAGPPAGDRSLRHPHRRGRRLRELRQGEGAADPAADRKAGAPWDRPRGVSCGKHGSEGPGRRRVRPGDGPGGHHHLRLAARRGPSRNGGDPCRGRMKGTMKSGGTTKGGGIGAMKGRDLVSLSDLSGGEMELVLDLTGSVKAGPKRHSRALARKTLAMIFEKPSLRTRVTFETGMTRLGGHAIYLGPQEGKLGERESVPDVARNLERWVDGIVARTFSHQLVKDLAQHARIPVINGLTDEEHPCQAIADFFTIREVCGRLKGIPIAYLGDGNNVAVSLIHAAGLTGVRSPRGG